MSVDVPTALMIVTNMANNDRAGQQGRTQVSRPRGVLELSTTDALLAQNKLITQQIESLNTKFAQLLPQQVNAVNPPSVDVFCDMCGGNHPYSACPYASTPQGEVQFVNNQQRQGNFSNPPFRTNFSSNFQQGWRNNPGQGNWRGDAGSSNRPQFTPLSERTTKLEETLEKFMEVSLASQQSNEVFQKNTESSIRNLETQVGQIAKQLSEFQASTFLSGNTTTNPREHCMAITTRSGKEIGRGIGDHSMTGGEILKEKEDEEEKKKSEVESGGENKKSEDERKKKKSEGEKLKEKIEVPQLKELPYPPHPSKKDKERQLARFFDIFKSLQINIPFLEAMEQMPTYARFMKEILTKKRSFSEERVELAAGCSAIIQKPLPPKAEDPGGFTIPVTIGVLPVGNALLDLGASINLISFSMLKRLGNLTVKPTRMTLQLADRSVIFPYGVAEDVLLKVGKFTFPVDFVVIKTGEDAEIPLILGRPFLVSSGALIDAPKGELTLRVDEEQETFQVCGKQASAPNPSLHTDVKNEEVKQCDGVRLSEYPPPFNDSKPRVEKNDVKNGEGVATPDFDDLRQPWPSGGNSFWKHFGGRPHSEGEKASSLSCLKPP